MDIVYYVYLFTAVDGEWQSHASGEVLRGHAKLLWVLSYRIV